MKHFKLVAYVANGELRFAKNEIERGVITMTREIVPPRSQMIVPTSVKVVGIIMTKPFE